MLRSSKFTQNVTHCFVNKFCFKLVFCVQDAELRTLCLFRSSCVELTRHSSSLLRVRLALLLTIWRILELVQVEVPLSSRRKPVVVGQQFWCLATRDSSHLMSLLFAKNAFTFLPVSRDITWLLSLESLQIDFKVDLREVILLGKLAQVLL